MMRVTVGERPSSLALHKTRYTMVAMEVEMSPGVRSLGSIIPLTPRIKILATMDMPWHECFFASFFKYISDVLLPKL